MTRRPLILLVGMIGMGLLAGCLAIPGSRATPTPLPPEAATATAALGAKLTAIAVATAHPATPAPPEEYPTVTEAWTPGANEIVASDSGKTYAIGVTTRISLILERAAYPPENLTVTCVPAEVLGRVSNLPQVPPQYYAVRYEGVKAGECLIRNDAFQVTIKVVEQP
jgi:hypothetical protein